MSVLSWFRFTKLPFALPVTKPSRRPASTRPFLESLEERAVPSAASTNLLGGVNNATTFSALNTQQSGIVLPSSPSTSSLSGLAVGNIPSEGTIISLAPALTGLVPILAQDLLTSQLRSLGVNSQGQQGQPPLFTPNSIVFSSYGFGSGTQPNQPWVPNAYNLGLANGQMSFPSMADFGSHQSLGIRYPRFAHLWQQDNDPNQPQPLLPARDALASTEADQDDNPRLLEQADDAATPAEEEIDSDSELMLRTIPLVPHAATEEMNTVQAASVKQMPRSEPALPQVRLVPDFRQDNGADEALVQARLAPTPEGQTGEENVFAFEESAQPAETQFLDSDLVHDVPALESLNLPGTLLLTVLTPAQMMVVMAEFPVATVPSERGEELAEYSEME